MRNNHLALRIIPVSHFLVNWCWSVTLVYFIFSDNYSVTSHFVLRIFSYIQVCISQFSDAVFVMCLFNLLFMTSLSYFLSLCFASREALRWTIFSMQATGHILLGSSCYIEQLLEEEERAEKSLTLPQESRIRQLQSMLLGKISYWWWTRAWWWWSKNTLSCVYGTV